MGFGRPGPLLRPQAARLSSTLRGTSRRRFVGGMSPFRIPISMGRTSWPIVTWKSGNNATASGSRAGRPRASRPAYARSAARGLPRPTARCASRARRRETARAGLATRGCAPRENPDGTWIAPARMSASGRAGRGPRAGPRAFAPGVASARRWRDNRPASRAWRSGGRRTARITAPARKPGSPTAAPMRMRNGAPAGRGAGSARRRGSRPGSVSAAASARRSRAGRPARPAAKSASGPSGGSIAERRAAGCCTRCGGRVHDGLSRCARCAAIEDAGHCPERKNARSRKLYAARRARGECTSCGAPAQGASRCAPCAEKSYHGSAHFRGIPVWDPLYTVVEIETGVDHGTYDSMADVALCLAFAKLDRDRVEIVTDAPVTARLTAWE